MSRDDKGGTLGGGDLQTERSWWYGSRRLKWYASNALVSLVPQDCQCGVKSSQEEVEVRLLMCWTKDRWDTLNNANFIKLVGR